MCLLFFDLDNDVGPDSYRLVLINIRDECYTRPATPAHFWKENESILGGRDLLQGRSGGTWLAMNKENGKLAVLLNILQPNHEIISSKRGRGFIVNDFVCGSESCKQYLQRLSDEGDEYNGFQSIVLQIKDETVDGAYYSNFAHDEPEGIGCGVHGYGNSLNPKEPWPKVTYGRKRFEAVRSKHKSTKTKEQLIEDLFEIMMDKTFLPVDKQMMNQGYGREIRWLRRLSSLCVQMPEVKYGSRTWTVILVDGNNHVDFVERTLEEPIQCNETGVENKWLATRYSFNL